MDTSAAMAPEAAERTPSDEVHLTRRGIDRILIAIGILATLVFVVAGALLLWGNQFSADYVNDELTSQRITFPPEEALIEEGRDDLVEFAGEDLTTGKQAEAYASYIDGHLQETADGLTYAELGGVQREARAAVTEATEAGAPQEDIDALQAELDTVNGQRDSLFRGETLRGLLLSAYAWSTVGSIAGWAAIGAFIAAALMAVLVVLGIGHYRKTTHPA